jgi:hypothetical protein
MIEIIRVSPPHVFTDTTFHTGGAKLSTDLPTWAQLLGVLRRLNMPVLP